MGREIREAILKSANEQFIEKGFSQASLRVIAKNAGCTTGAIYTQFGSKEALFHALVSDAYNGFVELLHTFSYTEYTDEAELFAMSASNTMRVLDYGYAHFDAFKLLITRSEGTRYENFFEALVEFDYSEAKIMVQATHPERLERLEASEYAYKVFVRLTFQAMLMPFVDNLTLEDARRYYEQVNKMFLTGWRALNLF